MTMNQTAVKIKLEIADAKQKILEEILLRKQNGTIEVPKNSLISKGNYLMGRDDEYYQFKDMVRKAAEKKYGHKIGISFSKYEEPKAASFFGFFSL